MAGEVDPNAHFKRYTGLRPRMLDPRYPTYNPERDFGQISAWLLSVYHAINTFPIAAWVPMAVLLGLIEHDHQEEQLREQLKVAWLNLLEFLEAACGAPIGDREGAVIEDDDKLVSFKDAMQQFSLQRGPANAIIQAMLGNCALDMLFFAGRQERLTGLQGPQTLDKILPTIQAYGDAIRSGAEPELVMIAAVKRASEAAYASGMSISTVVRVVETHLLDVQSRTSGAI